MLFLLFRIIPVLHVASFAFFMLFQHYLNNDIYSDLLIKITELTIAILVPDQLSLLFRGSGGSIFQLSAKEMCCVWAGSVHIIECMCQILIVYLM